MRFIRKGGRIIPIREKAEDAMRTKLIAQANVGTVAGIGSLGVAYAGAKTFTKGHHNFAMGVRKAQAAASVLGRASPEYKASINLARAGVKSVRRGAGLMGLGFAGYAAGLGVAVAAGIKGARALRKKNG